MSKISVVVLSNGDPLAIDRTLSSLVPDKASHQILLAHAGDTGLIESALERRSWVEVLASPTEQQDVLTPLMDAADGDVLVLVPAGSRIERGWGSALPTAGSDKKWEAGPLRLRRETPTAWSRLTATLSAPFLRGPFPGQALAARAIRVRESLHGVTQLPRAAEMAWNNLSGLGVPLSRLPVHCIVPHGPQISFGAGSVLVFCQKLVDSAGRKIFDAPELARMERRLVAHTLRTAQSVQPPLPVSVAYHPLDPSAAVQVNTGTPYLLFPQDGTTTGQRLAHATSRVAATFPGPLLAVRTHCPSVTSAILELALRKLNAYDIVLGPSDKNDVWLIGMRSPNPEFLADVDWEAPEAMATFTRRAVSAGLSVGTLEPLRDLDSAEDFRYHYLMGYLQ